MTIDQTQALVPLKESRTQSSPEHREKASGDCRICGKSYGTVSRLRIHVRTVHEKERRHECEYCGKCFGLRGNLRQHIERKHNNPKERPNLGKHF